jgi:hypothetical protein
VILFGAMVLFGSMVQFGAMVLFGAMVQFAAIWICSYRGSISPQMILQRHTLRHRVYIRSTFRLSKTPRNHLNTDQLGKESLKKH